MADPSPAPPLVAVLDSGVNPRHPHLAHVQLAGFAEADETGSLVGTRPPRDLHGHGTAVAAAVFRHHRCGRLLAVRVLDDRLVGDSRLLCAAIDLAAQRGARLINVSMGTTAPDAATALAATVERAAAAGATVIAAVPPGGRGWPADLPGVVGVRGDPGCPPDRAIAEDRRGGLPGAPECALLRFRAHAAAVPPGGTPRQGNLAGSSLAAGHVTGLAAALLAQDPHLDALGIAQRLARGPWSEGGNP